nr:VOC family protein [uncultured Caproiciproducens sp.]
MDSKKQELGFEVMHIGFNSENLDEAQRNADILKDLFGFDEKDTPISIFSSSKIEIMKYKSAGRLGHVAVGTNDAEAAKKYLVSKGIEFNENSASFDSNGKLKLIYLKNDIAGFAFHLIQKS